MFTEPQKIALAANLDKAHVKSRLQSGRSLSYIEGWTVIAEANRIFGFDGWTRETVSLNCVSEREREIGKDKAPGWSVTYTARVRVIVFAGDTLVTREGCGAGHGIDRDIGQAHESALKEAETDAMKRALMTFGNPFGLALYDKTQANVGTAPAAAPAPAPSESGEVLAGLLEEIAGLASETALQRWWATRKVAGTFSQLSEAHYQQMVAACSARKAEVALPITAAG